MSAAPMTDAELDDWRRWTRERDPQQQGTIFAHSMTALIARLDAAESALAAAPVAWQHESMTCSLGAAGSHHIISDKVKQLWLKANPKQVEHYTRPLYALARAQPEDK